LRASFLPLAVAWLCSCLAGMPARAQSHARGSLIQPDAYRGLTADRRAHNVGDTLTVVVVETAHASVSANTDGSNVVKLGAEARTPRGTYPYGLGLTGSDQGQGQTSRAGILQAQLAVRVVDIEPDGMLRVHGEQQVVINGEKQRIALSGLVRQEDILASNVLPSNRISDAQIEFTGAGDVSEAQRRSVIYRFMKWLRLL
jgi:flagellar L-ring protein FlgH